MAQPKIVVKDIVMPKYFDRTEIKDPKPWLLVWIQRLNPVSKDSWEVFESLEVVYKYASQAEALEALARISKRPDCEYAEVAHIHD